jgi:hypothetical protein
MFHSRRRSRRVSSPAAFLWLTRRILESGLVLNLTRYSISRLSKWPLSLITFTNDTLASARPLNMEIHIQSFAVPHFPSLMIAMSKPAYLSILEYSPNKPVIVFVPSRRQCRLTVDNLITHCAADDDPERFLYMELDKLQPHLDHLTDKGLTETLTHGIGYYHEALSRQDKIIVQRLFESGAIQVLVASKVRNLDSS